MSVSAYQNDRRRRLEIRFETILIVAVLVFVAVVFAPTTLVVCFAMAPTVLTLLLDGDPAKNRTLAIGSLNLAGTVPALFELWARWNTIPGAIEMIATVHPWRLAIGGAVTGWLLTLLIPPLSANYVVRQRETSIEALERRLDAMRNVWGDEVDWRWRREDPMAEQVHENVAAATVTAAAQTDSAESAPESR
jgi:hypothetical protein